MRLRLAKFLAYQAAAVDGNPLLTGEEAHWYSLGRGHQNCWLFIAATAVVIVREEPES